MRALRAATIAAVLLAAGLGCARIRIHRPASPKDAPGEHYRESQEMALLGFENFSRPIDLSERCPGGWTSIETETGGWQILIHFITLNLYSPWTAHYECRVARPKTGPS